MMSEGHQRLSQDQGEEGRVRQVEPDPEEVAKYVEQHPERVARIVERHTSFSGPLPPPTALREYDAIMPGLAERLVQMAEQEQDHRHATDNRIIGLYERGQWFGFFLGLVGLAVGGGLLYIGAEIGGIAALLLSMGTLAGSLLFSRRRGRLEEAGNS